MEVKVYSTPSCPWCVRVKEYLSGLGVPYTNVNIAEDRASAMELVKKTKQIGVPVTFIGDKFVVGFNEPELEALLKENGLIA
ncbi:glutaredoxin domain-containing protein [Cloacibacillus sp. An23]|uniref:glutaredoxin family protein n=1 Tax=Cloacibacillus sp. An23 TaxID=1965591 RepID=UPI000B3AAE96|nr:glutaredoxin domain-containing protein [Cloacibacillus sp. An23]OUO91600.1 NrdH-redoxin [Cloacibacillus sp. An23]